MATQEDSTETGVRVMYVGKKPFAIDNVAGSGKSWEGRGAVQDVSADQAKILFGYPDSWWPEGPLPTQEAVDANLVEFYKGGKIPDSVVLPKDPKEMTLKELNAHALKLYGQKLHGRTLKAALEELAFLEDEDEKVNEAVVTTATKVTARRASTPRAKAKPAAKGRGKSAKHR